DAEDHRDTPGSQEVKDSCGIDLDDIAHAAEVNRLTVDDDAAPTTAEESRILTTESGGDRAVRVDLGDQLRIHLAGEHHTHDADRLRVRDTVPALELARDREAIEHVRDLGSAAVHHDRLHADVTEVCDVLG